MTSALQALASSSRFQRFLEMIPGMTVWTSFVLGIILSFTAPLAVIIFVILFDLYWLFRVAYFVIVLLFAWRHYHEAQKTDWMKRLDRHKDWKKILHVVFLPMVREGEDIVSTTLDALCASRYPMDRCMIVLAGEERARDHFEPLAARMKKKYASKFFDFLVTVHPSDLPGEIVSKGANMSYAGGAVKKYIDAYAIPYESVVVSAFDIDTIVHRDYLACLTDAYCANPDPTRASYQPIVLYNNNIWTSPAAMRLAAFSTSFWLMSELARPDRLFTFSSHSMSFQALVDVGFWQKDIVSEDSRIFLQCFLKYHGDYRVVPLYVPLSMDTVVGDSLWKSFKNLYKQQRRWAWGVEHFPFMVTSFMRDPLIPLKRKITLLWNQCEGMYTWATAPLIILILGRLPLWAAQHAGETSVLAQNAPFVLEILLNLSMVGIFVIGFLSFFLLPPQPASHPAHRKIFMILQWLLLPVSIIFFSALPALDAQTRLMTGSYLGFNVTEKKRKDSITI